MSTDIEDRLNEAAADNGMPWLREASSLIHDLREQVEDLRGLLHFCPTCGEACKDCLCTEQREATLRAERDALRKALEEGVAAMDKYLALYEGRIPGASIQGVHGLSTRDGQFFMDRARALLSPERSSSTAAKGGETDG